MKNLFASLLLTAILTPAVYAAADAPPVTASPPAAAAVKAPNAQQLKMSSCNAEAGTKQLKGAERKTFMKGCLSASGSAASTATTPQERMKSCNHDAGDKQLKGDARKSFMSDCLKAK
jgi:psiF repeat